MSRLRSRVQEAKGRRALFGAFIVLATVLGTTLAGATVLPPAPYVSSVGQAVGPPTGGDTVPIYGLYFTGATGVTFGGVHATRFVVVRDDEIDAVTPPSGSSGPSTVDVVVTSASGPSNVTANTKFSYIIPVRPTVTGFNQSRGIPAGGEVLTIYGNNLTNATAVHFGTVPAVFTVVNDLQILVTTPAVALPYLYDVTVTTPLGTSPTSPADWFLYRSKPVVWGVSPNSGPLAGGQLVTIVGDQFFNPDDVYFGGHLTSFTVINQHTITATVPAGIGPGTVPVVVLAYAGLSDVTLSSLYTYRQPGAPTVSSTVGHTGSILGGQTVVVTGTGFSGATSVRFGTTNATSFTVKSNTRLTVVVPPRATPDLVNINITAPAGINANDPTSWFQYTAH